MAEIMADILPKRKAKGVDFCGGNADQHYIIRSDFGCYMYSTNIHQGLNLTVKPLHPSCQGGDHYLASEDKFYIIKGNRYRCVSDLSKDLDSAVYDLHPKCEEGDHYLFAFGYFFIIFQSKGKFCMTSDLKQKGNGFKFDLDPDCQDGLYFWGTKNNIYVLKPKDEWGVQFYKIGDLKDKDKNINTFSVHSDVLNFLPGGLAVTHGPAFAKWELIKTIANGSDTPMSWEKRITRKVGYTKFKSSRIERNWKGSVSETYQTGTLIEKIAKFQFALTAEYGGAHINTENESWEEATEVEEKVNLTVESNKRICVWQYKLGFGKEDVLFCHDLVINNGPNPPTYVPLGDKFKINRFIVRVVPQSSGNQKIENEEL
uniref:Uncharacterized protein n=1 Tax=Astyanax mexicanus TaxID=7994 RepID=A0A8B9LBD6_ASTMX